MVSATSQGHTFYEYEDNRVAKLELQRFDEFELVPVNTRDLQFPLPRELIDQVVYSLFVNYLCSYNFRDAAALVPFNPWILKTVYEQIYGPAAELTLLQMLQRVSKTFCLLEGLHDDYLTCPNELDITPSVMLCIEPSLMHKPVFYPWEFRPEFALMEQTIFPATTVFPGALFGDTVLVSGAESDGIIDVTKFYHPVFMIGLQDYTSTLLTSEKHFERTDKFQKFSNLLVSIYGPTTGVFYMVKPADQSRNPFISSSDVYITY